MKLQAGGTYQYINSDGTLVWGNEEFPKEELKRAYDYFKNRALRKRLEEPIQMRTVEILKDQYGLSWMKSSTEEDVVRAYGRAEDEILGLDAACTKLNAKAEAYTKSKTEDGQ